MRKYGMIFLILLIVSLIWASGSDTGSQPQFHMEQNKLTVVMAAPDRNPYLYNPAIRDLQKKLNQVLTFNFEDHVPLRESGFWNKETAAALERFREMYHKKYNLQRYYAFSASDGGNWAVNLQNLNMETSFDSLCSPLNNSFVQRDINLYENMSLGSLQHALGSMPLEQRDYLYSQLQNSGRLQNMVNGISIADREVFKVNADDLLSGMGDMFGGQLGMAANIGVSGNVGLWSHSSVSLMPNVPMNLLGELPLDVKTSLYSTSPILGAQYKLNFGGEALNPAFYIPIFGEAISKSFQWLNRGMEINAFDSLFARSDYTWGGRSYFDTIYKDRQNTVELASGNYNRIEVDYTTRLGTMSLDLIRIYSSQSYYEGAFGKGWNLGYNYKVLWSKERNILRVMDGSGFNQDFEQLDGVFVPKAPDKSMGYYLKVELINGNYGQVGSRLRVTTADKVMTFRLFNGTAQNLFTAYKMTEIVDQYGFKKSLFYDTDAKLTSVKVYNPGNQELGKIDFIYDTTLKMMIEARIFVQNKMIRRLKYIYNASQKSLSSVYYLEGGTIPFWSGEPDSKTRILTYTYQKTGMKEAYEHFAQVLENTPVAQLEPIFSYFRYQDKTEDLKGYIPDNAFIEEKINQYKANRRNMFFEIYWNLLKNITLQTRMLFGYKENFLSMYPYTEPGIIQYYDLYQRDGNIAMAWYRERTFYYGNLIDTGHIWVNADDDLITASGFTSLMDYMYHLARGETNGPGFSYREGVKQVYSRAGFFDSNPGGLDSSVKVSVFNRIVSSGYKPGGSQTAYKSAAAPVLAMVAYYNSQVSLIEQYFNIPFVDTTMRSTGQDVVKNLNYYVSNNYILSKPKVSEAAAKKALVDFIIKNGQGYDPTLLFVVMEQLYQKQKLQEMKGYIGEVQRQFGRCIQESTKDFKGILEKIHGAQANFASSSQAGQATQSGFTPISTPTSIYNNYVNSLNQVKTKFDTSINEITKNLDAVADIDALALNRVNEPQREILLTYGHEDKDYNADEIAANVEKFFKDARNSESYKVKSLAVNGYTRSFQYQPGYSVYTDTLSNRYILNYDSKRNITALEYPDQSVLRLEYDAEGRVIKETSPGGKVTSTAYDLSGRVISKTLPDGRQWQYTYEHEFAKHQKKPSAITRPDKTVISMDYNDKGDLILRKIGDKILYRASYQYTTTGYQKEEWDFYNNRTLSEFDENYQVKQITYPDNGQYRYNVNAQGHILSEIRPDGTSITRSWDDNGHQRLETVKTLSQGEGTRTWEYDFYGQVVNNTDPRGKKTVTTYDYTHKKPARTIFPNEKFYQNNYDPEGRLVLTVDSDGKGQTYSYDNLGRLLEKSTTDGHRTVMAYDSDGLLKTEKVYGKGLDDATLRQMGWNNIVSDLEFSYDSAGRLKTETDKLTGSIRELNYDSSDKINSETVNKGTDKVMRTYEYDALGRLTKVEKHLPGSSIVYQTRSYNDTEHSCTITDSLGRETRYFLDFRNKVLKRETSHTLSLGSTPVRMPEVFEYNKQGKLVKKTFPDGSVKRYEYDGDLLVKEYAWSKNPNPPFKNYKYDVAGNRVQSGDYSGNRFYYDYNDLNLVEKQYDEEGGVTYFTYDVAGNKIEVIRGNQGPVQYTYNLNGKVTSILYPDGVRQDYVYDALGNLSAYKNAAGTELFNYWGTSLVQSRNSIGLLTIHEYDTEYRRIKTTIGERTYTFSYDIQDRLLSKQFPQGEKEEYTYTHQNGLLTVNESIGSYSRTVVYNEQGKTLLSKNNDPVIPGEETFTYDLNANVVKHHQYRGDTIYTYNQEGRVDSLKDPLGQVKGYTYDADGRAATVTDEFGNTTQYRYDKAGRLKLEIYPDNSRLSYTYDPAGNVRAKAYNQRTTAYTYNSRGDVVTETTPQGGVSTYTYDPSGRLQSLQRAGGTYNWDYYPNGKVKNATTPLGHTTSSAYNQYGEQTRIILPDTTVIRLDYDSNGKLKTRTEGTYTTVYTYTVEGYLQSATYPDGSMKAYEYTPSGSVINTLQSPQGLPLPANSRVTSLEYYPDGKLKTSVDPTGLNSTLQYDALGRPVLLRESAGGINRETHVKYEIISEGPARLQVISQWKTDENGREILWQSRALDFRGQVLWYKVKQNGTIVKVLEHTYNLYGKPLDSVQYQSGGGKARTEWTYNEWGDPVSLQSPTGLLSTFEYDEWGRIIRKTEGDRVSAYTYDQEDRISKVINPLGQSTTLEYNFQGQVIKETDETRGVIQEARYDYRGLLLWSSTFWKNKRTGEKYTYDWAGRPLSHTNTLGGVTSYEYDGFGQLITESRPQTDGILHQYTYDKKGYLTDKKVYNQGKEYNYTYTYDPWGHVQAVRYPDNSLESSQLNAWGLPKQETDRYGYTQTYSYDNNLRLKEQIQRNPGGVLKVNLEYDWNGNVTLQQANDRRTQYIYDINSRLIEEKVYTASGSHSRVLSYDSFDNIRTQSDYLGNTSTYQYDPLDRPIKITDAMGQVYDYIYNDTELKITEGRGDKYTTSYYDGFGNLIRQTDPMGHQTQIKYNNANQPEEIINALGYKNFIQYDQFSRVTAEIDPYGKAVSYEYDALDNIRKITDKEGHATQINYDWAGRPVEETDALLNVSKTSYTIDKDARYEKITSIDPKGNATQQFYYNDQILKHTDALGHSTHYYYDPYSQLNKITDANGNSSMLKYDLIGNVIEKQTALGFKTTYQYDANSQMIKEINALNNITSHYDELGRLTAKVYSDGNRKDFTYDIHDRITKAGDNHSAYSYQYDKNDNLLTKIDLKNNSAVYYRYDALGQRTNMQTPGLQQNYRYDAMGQLTYTEARNAKEKISIAYHYNPDGTLEHKEFSTGLKTAYQYDALNQIKQIENLTNNKALSSYSYTYDKVGNRITEIEQLNSKTINKSFQYDSLNRLTHADYGNNEYETFSYSATGNRLKKITQEGSTSYSYDSDNRLLSEQNNTLITRYTYDQAGRLIMKQAGNNRENYSYDARDLMTRYTKTQGTAMYQTDYGYDVLNQRTAKTTAGKVTRFTYDGDNILSENETYHVNNLQVNGYEGRMDAFSLTAYTKDALGSVTGEVTRNTLTVKSYLAYGTGVNSQQSIVESRVGPQNSQLSGIAFTGHYLDNESGLYYARNRYYDPGIGRFTERDLIDEYTPDGLNKYMYADNNPVNYWDPMGLQTYGTYGEIPNNFERSHMNVTDWQYQSPQTTWGSSSQNSYANNNISSISHQTVSSYDWASSVSLGNNSSYADGWNRNGINERLGNMTSIGPNNFNQDFMSSLLDKLQQSVNNKIPDMRFDIDFHFTSRINWDKVEMDRVLAEGNQRIQQSQAEYLRYKEEIRQENYNIAVDLQILKNRGVKDPAYVLNNWSQLNGGKNLSETVREEENALAQLMTGGDNLSLQNDMTRYKKMASSLSLGQFQRQFESGMAEGIYDLTVGALKRLMPDEIEIGDGKTLSMESPIDRWMVSAGIGLGSENRLSLGDKAKLILGRTSSSTMLIADIRKQNQQRAGVLGQMYLKTAFFVGSVGIQNQAIVTDKFLSGANARVFGKNKISINNKLSLSFDKNLVLSQNKDLSEQLIQLVESGISKAPHGTLSAKKISEISRILKKEVAVVSHPKYGRLLVTGDINTVHLPKGIDRIIMHTHPGGNLVPSGRDIQTLNNINQNWSLIADWNGNVIKFYKWGK